MGSEDFYPEERPVRRVAVDGFWMDEHPVTAAEFRRFVRETGYVTVAERPLDPAHYPGRRSGPARARARSCSARPRGPVDLDDFRNWWEYLPGAYWKRPGGPGTTINGRDRHPVVQVAYEDAEAYAAWVGQGAADRGRVGVRRARWARGRRLRVGRRARSRTASRWRTRGRASSPGRTSSWTGSKARRPWQLPAERLRPVRHDRERLGVDVRLVHARHPGEADSPCCVPTNPRVTSPEASYDVARRESNSRAR